MVCFKSTEQPSIVPESSMDSAEYKTDSWLARLREVPQESLALFVAGEDARMSAELTRLAADIHTAMSAWHSLGTVETVTKAFQKLEQRLAARAKRGAGLLRNLVRRVTDFIDESAPASLPEETLRQLEQASRNATTYEQRLKLLADEHSAALHDYSVWIAALTQHSSPIELQEQRLAVQSTIRRSAEVLSAQQQLLQAMNLQLQSVRKLADDVQHMVRLAQSLAMNSDAAAQLEEQRIRVILRDYLAR